MIFPLNFSFYCLLSSWFWADVVNFDTTRVSARFSARKRSFSCLYLFNSYNMWFSSIYRILRANHDIFFWQMIFFCLVQKFTKKYSNCIKFAVEKKEEKKERKEKEKWITMIFDLSIFLFFFCIKIKQMTWYNMGWFM